MSLLAQIRQAGREAVEALFHQQLPAEEILVNDTRPEFEGHYTLVMFPLQKYSGRNPADTGKTVGDWLVARYPAMIEKYNVIKGFLNLTITDGYLLDFLEKRPGEAPYLARIFNFNFSAFASMGLSGSAISGLKYSLGRLVHGITRSLMREDVEKIYEAFTSYSAPEMTGEAPFSNPAAGSRSNGAKEEAEPKGFEVPAR